jgi:hypothetical protein
MSAGTAPVRLESISRCLQGVIPAWIATCSADGAPNVTTLSVVHYVDSERVALSRQFFNKTSANLDANPRSQVILVDPETADQFVLDLRFLHTETEGPTFDQVKTNVDAIASQTGMTGVFRLRGVDIHRVASCTAIGESSRSLPQGGHASDPMPLLDELVRRLAPCVTYDDAMRVGLEALEDLFGFHQSILLSADVARERLFAVASNGYQSSSAGAEVPIGTGLVGVAAEQRRVVCVSSLARSQGMRAAISEALTKQGGDDVGPEIPLPGVEAVRSAAAVPLIVRDELTGVLYLESERAGDFGPGEERLLRVIGGHLAVALATLQEDPGAEEDLGESSDVAQSAPSAREAVSAASAAAGEAIRVVYYQADDSVFVDDDYVIKGVPGRILWRMVNQFAASGRTRFSNRELRLDESLGLPPGNDNLEARLLVLRKRLATADCGIELERVGRGRLELLPAQPLSLNEVPTGGPMSAAYRPPDDQ